MAVLLGLGQLAAHIPLSVLAGLLIPIGFKIIDFKGLKHLAAVPRADAVVLIIVLLITTFGSLIQAVGIGVALASLLFMKKAGDLGEQGLQARSLDELEDFKPWQDEQEFYNAYKDKVIIKHIEGPLFFGFTSYFKDEVKRLTNDLKAIIIRMERVPYMDQSGLYALEDVILDLEKEGVEVIFTGLQGQPRAMMEKIDIIPDLVPVEDIFDNCEDAFVYLRGKLES